MSAAAVLLSALAALALALGVIDSAAIQHALSALHSVLAAAPTGQ